MLAHNIQMRNTYFQNIQRVEIEKQNGLIMQQAADSAGRTNANVLKEEKKACGSGHYQGQGENINFVNTCHTPNWLLSVKHF